MELISFKYRMGFFLFDLMTFCLKRNCIDSKLRISIKNETRKKQCINIIYVKIFAGKRSKSVCVEVKSYLYR